MRASLARPGRSLYQAGAHVLDDPRTVPRRGPIRPGPRYGEEAMTVVYASDDVPVASRSEYWRHILSEALVPLEPLGPPDAPGLRLLLDSAGAVAVGELSHDGAGGARRTPRHIRRSDPELCKIDVLARGHGVVEQGGREAELRPGDLTLVDLSRPATWAMSSMSCVAVVFPRSLLPLPGEDVARLTATRIP